MIEEICLAAQNLSENHTGALIVLERRIGMRALEEDAVRLDIKVNALVLESIFYPNSPLHDGAVIIRDMRIQAAGCLLPLSTNEEIDKNLGTRHRAGIGITEVSDAIAIVVSEETGKIAYVKAGKVTKINNINELKLLLGESLG